MAMHRDNEAVAPLINDLSWRTTTALAASVLALQSNGHSPAVAVTIALDAVLMSAISLLKTGINGGMIAVTAPIESVLHNRITELSRMSFRVHEQRADGSFDPDGKAVN